MKRFGNVYKYKKSYNNIIEERISDEELHLLLKPDQKEGGVQKTRDLFKTLYTYDEDKGENNSPIYSFEIWYNKGTINFFIHTKEESSELHLRKQLSYKFPSSSFDSTPKKFVEFSEGDYIFCGDIILKRPFFEPVSTDKNDPYQNLFAEIDNKDKTKAMIQSVIQPAEDNWTDTFRRSAEDYAEKLEKEKKTIRKKFGLSKQKVSDSSIKREAEEVKNQVGKKGYKVDLKILISNPSKKMLLDLVKQINNILEIEYEASTGQTLTIREYNKENPKEFLSNMATRKMDSKEYKGWKSAFSEIFSYIARKRGYNTNLLMSIDELAEVIHIPKESKVPEAPIKWTNAPATRIPAELEEVDEMNLKENKKLVDMLMKERKNFREKLKSQDI